VLDPQVVHALAGQLRTLGDLTGASELPAAVDRLLTACVSAVPSTLAVRVTSPALGFGRAIETEGILAAREACRASLRLDLLGGDPRSCHPVAVSVLILAGQVGAFADFVGGADPLARPGVRIIRRTVDEDVSQVWTETSTGDADLDDAVPHGRIVHRAVGVLIDRGYLPDEALDELRRQATSTDRTLLDQAWEVLRSTAPTERHDDGTR
jgi:hypothetical protein